MEESYFFHVLSSDRVLGGFSLPFLTTAFTLRELFHRTAWARAGVGSSKPFVLKKWGPWYSVLGV